jgi:hypothetical protein
MLKDFIFLVVASYSSTAQAKELKCIEDLLKKQLCDDGYEFPLSIQEFQNLVKPDFGLH